MKNNQSLDVHYFSQFFVLFGNPCSIVFLGSKSVFHPCSSVFLLPLFHPCSDSVTLILARYYDIHPPWTLVGA